MFNFFKKNSVEEDPFVELTEEQLTEVTGGTPGISHYHKHHHKHHMKKHHHKHHHNTMMTTTTMPTTTTTTTNTMNTTTPMHMHF